MAMGTAAYFLRGLRWLVLLNTQQKLPVFRVFEANSAGYLGNNVLPARAGELIRTAMISSQSGVSKTFVLTTALAERLMDAIVLVIAGTVVLHLVPDKPEWLQHLATPLLAIACIGAVLLFGTPLLEGTAKRWVKALPLPENLSQRLSAMIEHIAAGVRSFHDPISFAQFLLLTVGIWSLDAIGSVILATSLGMKMSFIAALLMLVGLALGSALPSTPGYVGIYQFVVVTVLRPFHFTREQAIAFSLVAQAGSVFITVVLGSYWLVRYRKMGSPTPES